MSRTLRATRGATVLTEWTSLGPGRDASSRHWTLQSPRVRELGGGFSRVEGVTGAKHRMHDNGEFAGDGYRGAFEANLLA